MFLKEEKISYKMVCQNGHPGTEMVNTNKLVQ